MSKWIHVGALSFAMIVVCSARGQISSFSRDSFQSSIQTSIYGSYAFSKYGLGKESLHRTLDRLSTASVQQWSTETSCGQKDLVSVASLEQQNPNITPEQSSRLRQWASGSLEQLGQCCSGVQSAANTNSLPELAKWQATVATRLAAESLLLNQPKNYSSFDNRLDSAIAITAELPKSVAAYRPLASDTSRASACPAYFAAVETVQGRRGDKTCGYTKREKDALKEHATAVRQLQGKYDKDLPAYCAAWLEDLYLRDSLCMIPEGARDLAPVQEFIDKHRTRTWFRTSQAAHGLELEPEKYLADPQLVDKKMEGMFSSEMTRGQGN
jgi:hypothetical protein